MSQPHDERDTALVRRALELAALGPQADPNPRVGCRHRRPRRCRGRRGPPPRCGHPARRGGRAGPAPANGPAAAPPTSASSPATTPAAPVRAPRRCSTRGWPASSTPSPTPARCTGGGADTLRAAGVEVVGGVLEHEALRRSTGPGPSPSSTAGRWSRGSSPRRWTGGRPPPTAAAPGSPARWRGPTCTTCAPSATPSSSAPAPSSRTTRTSPCATPDGTLRGRQPLRVVMGLRPTPPTARVLDAAAPTLAAAHPRPGRGAGRALRP